MHELEPGDRGRELVGLDNIPLGLPFAGPGSRGIAMLTDSLLVGILQALWIWGVLTATSFNLMSEEGGQAWVVALVIAGIFVLQYGYFAGLEIALGGRTPGKAWLRLRVVTRDGGAPDAGSFLIRNLVRTVDLLVGLWWMLFDRRHRRLGDLLAGTVVVYEDPGQRMATPGRLPASWGAAQVAVTEELVSRLDELRPERARELASLLLAQIAREAPELLPGGMPGDPVETLRWTLVVNQEER